MSDGLEKMKQDYMNQPDGPENLADCQGHNEEEGVEAPAIVARRLLEERRRDASVNLKQVDTALAQLAGRVIGDILQLLPQQGKELPAGVMQVLTDFTIRDRGGVIPTPDHTPENCAELAARYIRKISEKEAVDLYRDQLAQEYHDHPAEYDADSHLFRDVEFDNPLDYEPPAK